MITIKTKLCIALVLMLPVLFAEAKAQTPADTQAIKQTALDYIQDWYEGNAERMERALHPELAKRIVGSNPEGRRHGLPPRQGELRSADGPSRSGVGRDGPALGNFIRLICGKG